MLRSSPFCTADILKFGIPKPLAGFFNTQSVLGTLSASARRARLSRSDGPALRWAARCMHT